MRRMWVLLFGLLLINGMCASQASYTTPTPLEIDVHRLINNERANQGVDLQPLLLHSVLIEVARAHSQDMLDNQYFSHTDLQGKTVADRVSDAGVIYSVVGENLFTANGYPESQIAEIAVQGWMKSPGHRANILTDFVYTGIGVATDGNSYYITQVFVTAQKSHMESIGHIFDNNNLDNISVQDTKSKFSLTPQLGAGIFVVLMVLIGLDAKRRNNRRYRFQYRRYR